jgi:hypothetical protein
MRTELNKKATVNKKAAVQLTIETLVIIIGAVVILLIVLGLIFIMFVGPATGLTDQFPFLDFFSNLGGGG